MIDAQNIIAIQDATIKDMDKQIWGFPERFMPFYEHVQNNMIYNMRIWDLEDEFLGLLGNDNDAALSNRLRTANLNVKRNDTIDRMNRFLILITRGNRNGHAEVLPHTIGELTDRLAIVKLKAREDEGFASFVTVLEKDLQGHLHKMLNENWKYHSRNVFSKISPAT